MPSKHGAVKREFRPLNLHSKKKTRGARRVQRRAERKHNKRRTGIDSLNAA